VLSPGQHDGIAAAQSLFFAHSPQVPVVCRHTGAASGQFVFVVHSTQPSIGSHCRPPRHSFVPLTPHNALPGPGPLAFSVLPPHATNTAMKAPSAFPTRALARPVTRPSLRMMSLQESESG
jgi:hypothetical protein